MKRIRRKKISLNWALQDKVTEEIPTDAMGQPQIYKSRTDAYAAWNRRNDNDKYRVIRVQVDRVWITNR